MSKEVIKNIYFSTPYEIGNDPFITKHILLFLDKEKRDLFEQQTQHPDTVNSFDPFCKISINEPYLTTSRVNVNLYIKDSVKQKSLIFFEKFQNNFLINDTISIFYTLGFLKSYFRIMSNFGLTHIKGKTFQHVDEIEFSSNAIKDISQFTNTILKQIMESEDKKIKYKTFTY